MMADWPVLLPFLQSERPSGERHLQLDGEARP
jgi:hypothetical protein